MTTSEDIAQTIDLSNDLLALLQTLIDSGRSSVYVPFIYDAPEVYLVALVTSLTLIHHILAVNEINAVIGNTLFEGEAADGSPLPFATLRAIRVTVVGSDDDPNSGCDNADVNTEVACLVDAATEFPVLDAAVKQRIITEVQVIVPTYDPEDPAIAPDIQAKTAAQLYASVPFKYDRLTAATYAITRSRSNFVNVFPYGDGNQTGTVQGRVNGSFTNYSLQHSGIQTGSAIFISEVLYVGGHIPMVSAIAPAEPCDRSISNANTGWRVCCESVDGATLSWTGHQQIMAYFADATEANPLSATFDAIDTILYDNLEDYIRFGQTEGTNIGGGTWKPESEAVGKAYLYGLFSAGGPLEDIQVGDYIFIDQNQLGAHGFMIVGWGEAKNCPSALNSEENVDFSITRQQNGHEVPYVADFCYGYVTDDTSAEYDKTGWLQDPRPRPFYCSGATIDISDTGSQVNLSELDVPTLADYRNRLRGFFLRFAFKDNSGNFFGATWRFFRMPDLVVVPFPRLSKPPCEII